MPVYGAKIARVSDTWHVPRGADRLHEGQDIFAAHAGFSGTYGYDATPEQLRSVPATVRDSIEGRKNVRFDRAHFVSFGDSSLDFEVVYYVLSREYNDFMGVQQEINLAVYDRLRSEGLSFAFPTRTVHLVQGDKVA